MALPIFVVVDPAMKTVAVILMDDVSIVTDEFYIGLGYFIIGI